LIGHTLCKQDELSNSPGDWPNHKKDLSDE